MSNLANLNLLSDVRRQIDITVSTLHLTIFKIQNFNGIQKVTRDKESQILIFQTRIEDLINSITMHIENDKIIDMSFGMCNMGCIGLSRYDFKVLAVNN